MRDAYWYVDLEKNVSINAIRLKIAKFTSYANLYVLTGLTDTTGTLCKTIANPKPGAVIFRTCDQNDKVRYVRVKIDENDYLALYEVEVFCG